ncbi:MAG TPA: PIN domain nuclease [Solirubrobacteraceae bacterium]|jgi:predicted nucleic acid-binding protein|nr:PIN domain nuclease [Solirubrobacteraceae bacterium]
MILVDSSAWVEYLRRTGSPVHLRVRTALEEKVELASTDVVLMEILAGARDGRDRDRLRRLIYGRTLLAVEGPSDYEQAAELYRACRRQGETPPKLTDCLIAAVAIRKQAQVLHADGDFDAIARHTPLRIAALPP